MFAGVAAAGRVAAGRAGAAVRFPMFGGPFIPCGAYCRKLELDDQLLNHGIVKAKQVSFTIIWVSSHLGNRK